MGELRQAPRQGALRGGGVLILVTVGTSPFPYPRLARYLQDLLARGIITEKVLFQHGATDASGLDSPLIEKTAMLAKDEMRAAQREATRIISHAGQGTTRSLIEDRKPFIIVPRLKRFSEHIDDHQLEFARAMQAHGVQIAESLEALEDFLRQPPGPMAALPKIPHLADFLAKKYPSPFD